MKRESEQKRENSLERVESLKNDLTLFIQDFVGAHPPYSTELSLRYRYIRDSLNARIVKTHDVSAQEKLETLLRIVGNHRDQLES